MTDQRPELSLKKSMFWNSIGSLVYLGCSWLTTVLVVVLSPDYSDSGALAIAMSVGNLTATIALFKVRPVQVASSGDELTTGDFIGFRIACSLLSLIFSAFYCLFSVSSHDYGIVALYVIFKIVESFAEVLHGVFQIHNHLDYAGVSQIIRGILILISFIVGLSVFSQLSVSFCLMIVVSIFSIGLYDIPHAIKFGSIKPRLEVSALIKITKLCVAGFVSSLLITLVVSATRQRYGMSFGNEALGHYAAVATPCVIIQALASYIYAPLYGTIGKATHLNDGDSIRALVVRVVLSIVVMLFFSLFLAYLFGNPVLTLIYGSSIASFTYLLYGALICTACSACISFLLDILIIIGNNKEIVLFSLLPVFVCFIGMNFLFSDSNSINFVIIFSYLVSIIPMVFRFVLKPLK